MVVEYDKRIIIYPNYIDSKKTIAEGRRIPKSSACESPNVAEMVDCCRRGLQLRAEVESKFYARDFLVPGRIRVELFKADGQPVNVTVPNRRIAMLKIAQLVPKHPGRSEKSRAQAAKAAAPALPAANTKAGKKGKKGRK